MIIAWKTQQLQLVESRQFVCETPMKLIPTKHMYKVDELVVTAGTEIRTHNLMLSTKKWAQSQNNKIFGT
jgi:hypothetical protein